MFSPANDAVGRVRMATWTAEGAAGPGGALRRMELIGLLDIYADWRAGRPRGTQQSAASILSEQRTELTKDGLSALSTLKRTPSGYAVQDSLNEIFSHVLTLSSHFKRLRGSPSGTLHRAPLGSLHPAVAHPAHFPHDALSLTRSHSAPCTTRMAPAKYTLNTQMVQILRDHSQLKNHAMASQSRGLPVSLLRVSCVVHSDELRTPPFLLHSPQTRAQQVHAAVHLHAWPPQKPFVAHRHGRRAACYGGVDDGTRGDGEAIAARGKGAAGAVGDASQLGLGECGSLPS